RSDVSNDVRIAVGGCAERVGSLGGERRDVVPALLAFEVQHAQSQEILADRGIDFARQERGAFLFITERAGDLQLTQAQLRARLGKVFFECDVLRTQRLEKFRFLCLWRAASSKELLGDKQVTKGFECGRQGLLLEISRTIEAIAQNCPLITK